MQLSATNPLLTPSYTRVSRTSSPPIRLGDEQERVQSSTEEAAEQANSSRQPKPIFNVASQQNDVVFRLNGNDPQDSRAVKPSIAQYLNTENLAKREAIDSIVGLDVYV